MLTGERRTGSGSSHQAEADGLGATARRSVDAPSHAAITGAVAITPASNDPHGARTRATRVGHRTAGIGPIPVRYPLPDVPVHVVQTPGVRPLLPDLTGSQKSPPIRVLDIPGIQPQLIRRTPKVVRPPASPPAPRTPTPLRSAAGTC